MTKKNIVVIGGSYGGIAAIKALLNPLAGDPDMAITLIESRDARHHCIASYRSLVQPEFAKNLWIPYTNLFPKDSPHAVVQGTVQHIFHDHVLLSSEGSSEQQRIDFDYLLIATGSMVPSPAKMKVKSASEGLALLDQVRQDVLASQSIVVIGGGACGVELSGEMAYAFPTKSITLIHDMPALVNYPRFPGSFKNEACRYLESQGVRVVLNERVDIPGLTRENAVQKAERTITLTSTGETIQSDMQFFSIGMEVNTTFFDTLRPVDLPDDPSGHSKDLPFDSKTLLDPKTKAIRVRSTLQLDHDAFPHIFAVGDVSTADPVPTCMSAISAGQTAATNILNLVRKEAHHVPIVDSDEEEAEGYLCGPSGKLNDYAPIRPQMVLAMNPHGGVSHLPVVGTWFGSLAARIAKSSDLFSRRFWKEMNMPRP